MSVRIGVVTCETLPEPDHDERPLLDTLRARGAEARMLAWDDDSLDAGFFDLCVVRSTWNYPENPARFVAWLDRAHGATRLVNPVALMRTNLHKRYLDDLASAGLPTVPTRFVARGEALALDAICAQEGWSDVVVKPAIGAGSRDTRRYASERLRSGACFLEAMSAQRDMMVQPYLPSVETGGERNVIWIDGEATHAIEKAPRFADDDESVTGPFDVREDERELIDRALATLDEAPLYARLDVLRGDDGAPMIGEFELVEPSLFLKQHPPALERFADALVARASG